MYESLFYMSEYRGKNFLFDLYLRIFGYPIYVRRIESRAIFRLVGDLEGQVVLDLGCGDGFLSIPRMRGELCSDDVKSCHSVSMLGNAGFQ